MNVYDDLAKFSQSGIYEYTAKSVDPSTRFGV